MLRQERPIGAGYRLSFASSRQEKLADFPKISLCIAAGRSKIFFAKRPKRGQIPPDKAYVWVYRIRRADGNLKIVGCEETAP
jgi:hypothetical protein